MKAFTHLYRRKLKTPLILSRWLETTDEGLQLMSLELLAREVSLGISKTIRKYRDFKL
jgi:hypothetical protein